MLVNRQIIYSKSIHCSVNKCKVTLFRNSWVVLRRLKGILLICANLYTGCKAGDRIPPGTMYAFLPLLRGSIEYSEVGREHLHFSARSLVSAINLQVASGIKSYRSRPNARYFPWCFTTERYRNSSSMSSLDNIARGKVCVCVPFHLTNDAAWWVIDQGWSTMFNRSRFLGSYLTYTYSNEIYRLIW